MAWTQSRIEKMTKFLIGFNELLSIVVRWIWKLKEGMWKDLCLVGEEHASLHWELVLLNFHQWKSLHCKASAQSWRETPSLWSWQRRGEVSRLLPKDMSVCLSPAWMPRTERNYSIRTYVTRHAPEAKKHPFQYAADHLANFRK